MAIALDTSLDLGSVTANSLTKAYTCTGSNLVLFVGVLGDVTTDNITGVTYNTVAMTLVDKYHLFAGADRWFYCFRLLNPATGSNNIVISSSSSLFIDGVAASYTGAAGGIDNTGTSANDGSGIATLDNTIVTVADNCWHVAAGGIASGAPGAGTATTMRVSAAGGNMAFFDGNAAKTPAGSDTIQMTATGGLRAGLALIGATISPTAAAGATAKNLMLLGVGA